jgi:heptosyltransferase-2/heptosyltransferase-3
MTTRSKEIVGSVKHTGESVHSIGIMIAAASAPALQPIVVRFGRLGDMVLLSPLLNLLRRRYRMPCWLIGSGPWSKQLYRDHQDIAQIWSLAGRHTPLLLGPTWWRVLWALRHSGKSPVYVCEAAGSRRLKRIKSLLALAGVEPERCVFLRENGADGSEHRVDGLLRFGKQTPSALQAANFPCPEVNPAPQLKVLDEDRLECDAWIRTQGWSGRPIVLVQPGNRRSMRQRRWRQNEIDDKAWSLSNWAALLRCVHETLPQAQIVLCGSRQELGLLRRIRFVTGLNDVVAVRLPLRRLLALCEVAHSMISVDTGPAHVAAALGSPLIVLFGNSSPSHWLPRSVRGASVIGLGGLPDVCHVNQISVPAVFEAWRALPVRSNSLTGGPISAAPDLCMVGRGTIANNLQRKWNRARP